MTPKERKKWFKEKADIMQANKSLSIIRQEMSLVPDSLLVKLRDKMIGIGRIGDATNVENVREKLLKR